VTEIFLLEQIQRKFPTIYKFPIHNLSTPILPKKPHQTYSSSQYLFIYLSNKTEGKSNRLFALKHDRNKTPHFVLMLSTFVLLYAITYHAIVLIDVVRQFGTKIVKADNLAPIRRTRQFGKDKKMDNLAPTQKNTS